jgi:hypothetical protein
MLQKRSSTLAMANTLESDIHDSGSKRNKDSLVKLITNS